MRILSKPILLPVFSLVLLFFATPFCLGGELIEPTRTPLSAERNSGRISVLSEPPGLDVFLNNSKIGQTPILSVEVNAGIHKLRVQDSETEIFVKPGRSLQLSLYEGSFIEIPEKEEKGEALKKSGEEKATRGVKTVEPTEDSKEYEPLYWPLNPRGPIR
jgi:hypothetical protein